MIDPITGAATPAMTDPATLNPFAGPQVMSATALPTAVPGGGMGAPHPWAGAPGQGLLQMLQRMQMADPARFAQLMQSPMASHFGITPDNLAGMQSRQDIRQQFHPQGGPIAQPGATGILPPAPAPVPQPAVAPVAPQSGFAAPGIGGMSFAQPHQRMY